VVIILLAIALVVVGVPLAGFVLVSLASLREDSAHSLGYQPAGAIQAAARRVLGYHGSADGGPGRRPGNRGIDGDRSYGNGGFGDDGIGDGGSGFGDGSHEDGGFGSYLVDDDAANRPDVHLVG
jgi:hypothetical protein